MGKFNYLDYKGKYAMRCKTQEQAKVFTKYLHEAGRSWNSGASYLQKDNWHIYAGDTAYDFNRNSYCFTMWFVSHSYTILEFDDFDWSDAPDGVLISFKSMLSGCDDITNQ